ncbi:MAG: ABC transporter permease [Chloroflexi bacterium]|nr:ABC transporter permease [Chloroflexota bacterium]
MISRLRGLWDYRELIGNLVARDLKVRYKHSVLGFVWSLLNPLLLMTVFTVVFTVMIPNYQVPGFPVFILCALLPWNFFNTSVMGAVQSISGNGHLIKKVYFPREILTIASVLANFCNFLLSLPVLIFFVVLFRIPLTVWLLYLPLIMLVHVVFTLGVALVLATANVFYRDTTVIMEVVMQAWFFLTPIFYPIDLLPEWGHPLGIAIPVRRLTYILNPMASIIASYRSVVYGFTNGAPPAPPAPDFLLRTALTCAICFLIGYAVFTHYSARFAEEV